MVTFISERYKCSLIVVKIIHWEDILSWRNFLSCSHKYAWFLLFLKFWSWRFLFYDLGCWWCNCIWLIGCLHELIEKALNLAPIFQRVHHVKICDTTHNVSLLHQLDFTSGLIELFSDELCAVFTWWWFERSNLNLLWFVTSTISFRSWFGWLNSLTSVFAVRNEINDLVSKSIARCGIVCIPLRDIRGLV